MTVHVDAAQRPEPVTLDRPFLRQEVQGRNATVAGHQKIERRRITGGMIRQKSDGRGNAPPAKCGVPSADREPLNVSPKAQIAPPGTTKDSPPSWETIEALAYDSSQSEPKKWVWTISKVPSVCCTAGGEVEQPETIAVKPSAMKSCFTIGAKAKRSRPKAKGLNGRCLW